MTERTYISLEIVEGGFIVTETVGEEDTVSVVTTPRKAVDKLKNFLSVNALAKDDSSDE